MKLAAKKKARTPQILSRVSALGAFVVIAAIIIVYHAAPRQGLVWDDIYLTTKNPYLQSISGLPTLLTKDWWTASAMGESSAYFRPTVLFSFWINRLFGNTAASYHVGNLVLHCAASVLLLAWLRLNAKLNTKLLVCLGVWFGVAALNTETVVWISGRCESIGVCFGVGALLVNRLPGRRWMLLTYALALLSALSKEPFVFVPLLVVSQDVLLQKRAVKECVVRGAAALATVAFYFLLRRAADVPTSSAAASVGVFGALRSFAFMLYTMAPLVLLPLHLDTAHLYRPLPIVGLIAVGLVVVGGFAFLGWRIHRGSNAARLAAFGGAVLLVTLAPVSLVNADQGYAGERYFYFPLLGLTIMAAAGLGLVSKFSATTFVVGALALVQAPLTMARVNDWSDELTLFRSSVTNDPSNGYALYALADIEARSGDYDGAEQHLIAAEQLGWHDHHVDLVECFVYMRQKRHALAEKTCVKATESGPTDPRAWLNLASAYVNGGKPKDAEGAASNAIQLKPSYAEAYFVRGLARSRLGKTDNARADLQETLRINPSHTQATLALEKLSH